MQYWLWLKGPKLLRGALLPGIVPDRVIELCSVQACEESGLCLECGDGGAVCHVIESGTGRKFCPVLFADVVRPPWSMKDCL